MEKHKINLATTTIFTTTTTWCVQAYDLNSSVICFSVTGRDTREGTHDNKEWDSNQEHPSLRVSGYKRRKEWHYGVDITELRAYYSHAKLLLRLRKQVKSPLGGEGGQVFIHVGWMISTLISRIFEFPSLHMEWNEWMKHTSLHWGTRRLVQHM